MYCTMFNIYGVPQKQFDAFYAYDALREGKHEVALTRGEGLEGVYAMASGDADYACIGISQYRGAWRNYHIALSGLDADAEYLAEAYLTDDHHHFALVDTQKGKSSTLSLGKYLKANSILVWKIRKNT